VKLYASSRYLQKYGKPHSVEDLKDHKLIFPSTFNGYLINDARRLLEIARDNNIKKHNLAFLSNSVECLIEAAQQDRGIISVYENMRIIKNANLINVLPELTIQQRDEFFVYPKYLKDDKDIINIKDFLINRINSTCG
jgi:DNA-binding transcriptional LysR family regulator